MFWSIGPFKTGGGKGATKKDDIKRKMPRVDGAWNWHGGPRVLYRNGLVYAGTVSKNGTIIISSWSDGGGLQDYYRLHNKLEVDDHCNPTFLFRESDSKILVFYSEHNGTEMYMRLSTNAEDITAWGAETGLDASIGDEHYTHPSPIQLTGETNDPIYLFYRGRSAALPGGKSQWCYSKSTDNGNTWSARTVVYDNVAAGEGSYMKCVQASSTQMHFVVSDATPDANASLYHFYYEGGNYYQSDGTLIAGGAPLVPADLTQIYDGSVTTSRLYDIEIDGDGYPVIVYDKIVLTTDHRYRYARWNGSSWDDHEICEAGTYYATDIVTDPNVVYNSGGIAIDPSDVDTVYLSKVVQSNHEIWKYTTSDGGTTWSGEAITAYSKWPQARPAVIRDHDSDDVCWMSGAFAYWGNFKTDIVVH
jgi:hypothetical protein